MPSRYQVGAAGSHGFGTLNRTCLRGIRSGCRISRVRNSKSNMLTRYQVGLQDLTGSEHQIVHAYEVSGRGCRISRVWNNSPTCMRGTCIRTGLRDLTGKDCRISRVRIIRSNLSGRGCRISQVGNCRSYMLTRY